MRSIGRRPRGFGGRAPGKKVAAVRNDKIKTQRLFAAFILAVRTRLELATPGVTGRYSNQTELPHLVFPDWECKYRH